MKWGNRVLSLAIKYAGTSPRCAYTHDAWAWLILCVGTRPVMRSTSKLLLQAALHQYEGEQTQTEENFVSFTIERERTCTLSHKS